jgi:hypothetical protein
MPEAGVKKSGMTAPEQTTAYICRLGSSASYNRLMHDILLDTGEFDLAVVKSEVILIGLKRTL